MLLADRLVACRRVRSARLRPTRFAPSMSGKELGEKQTLTVERCWRGRRRQASRAWAIGSPGVAHVDATTARPTSSRPTRRASRRSRRWSGKRTLGEKQTLTVERCWRGRRRALGVISMLPRPHGPRRGRRRERRPASRSPTHGSPAASARASSVRPSGSASHEFFSAPSTTSTGTGRGERAAHDGRPAMGRPGRQLVAGVVWRGGRRCLPAKQQQITNEPNEPRTRYPHQAPPRDVRGPSSHGTHAHRAGPTRTRPRRELKLI